MTWMRKTSFILLKAQLYQLTNVPSNPDSPNQGQKNRKGHGVVLD